MNCSEFFVEITNLLIPYFLKNSEQSKQELPSFKYHSFVLLSKDHLKQKYVAFCAAFNPLILIICFTALTSA